MQPLKVPLLSFLVLLSLPITTASLFRADHLRTLLFNLHSLLPRQQLDYGIYIVEQNGAEAFNRAMLFNVGAAEALKQYDYQCFIFHDVDLMPEDDRNIYSCPVQVMPKLSD